MDGAPGSVDDWWSTNPEWEVISENSTTQCFGMIRDGFKRQLYRKIYDTMNGGNCSAVWNTVMFSSGWGADILHLVKDLKLALHKGVPMQITAANSVNTWWHYAAIKKTGETPTCPERDMFCHFLALSRCKTSLETFDFMRTHENVIKILDEKEEYEYKHKVEGNYEDSHTSLLRGYLMRQQTWLRHAVFQYLAHPENMFFSGHASSLQAPCAVIHVRRGDVILHGQSSRRYFAIREYIEKGGEALEGKQLLLLTDDQNAIEEAIGQFPDRNWTCEPHQVSCVEWRVGEYSAFQEP